VMFCKKLLASTVAIIIGSISLGGCQTVKSLNATFISSTYEEVNGKLIDEAKGRINSPAVKERNALTDVLDSFTISENGDEVGFNIREKIEKENLKNSQMGISAQQQETRELLSVSTQELTGSGAKNLNGYIQSIADRVIQQWPHEKPSPAITSIVVKNESYWAGMSENNVLRLNTGVLVNADDEDEVAAIIAHEVSHALLKHHYARDQKEIENKAFAVAANLAASYIIENTGNTDSASAAKIMLSSYALTKLNSNILFPAWERHLENEADLLAIDLLYKSGYDWEKLITVFERTQDQEAINEKEVIKNEKILEDRAALIADSGNIEQSFALSLEKSISQIGRSFKGITSSHASSEKRIEETSFYMQREYEDDFPPNPTIERFEKNVWQGEGFSAIKKSVYGQRAKIMLAQDKFDEAYKFASSSLGNASDPDPAARSVMYYVQKQRGNDAKALEHLEIARKSSGATIDIFDSLVSEYEKQKKWGDANDAWKERFDRFYPSVTVDHFLPKHIGLLVKSGDKVKASSLLADCQKMGTRTYGRCEYEYEVASNPLGDMEKNKNKGQEKNKKKNKDGKS